MIKIGRFGDSEQQQLRVRSSGLRSEVLPFFLFF